MWGLTIGTGTRVGSKTLTVIGIGHQKADKSPMIKHPPGFLLNVGLFHNSLKAYKAEWFN